MAEGNDFNPLGEVLAELERDDPAVAAAAASFRAMAERLSGRGPGLSPAALARLYDLSVEPERESAYRPAPAPPPADESPGQR